METVQSRGNPENPKETGAWEAEEEDLDSQPNQILRRRALLGLYVYI